MSDAPPPPASKVPQASPLGRFKPGASGNPTGRSKVQLAILDALRAAGPAAKDRLLELLRSSDEKVALAAARDILDRVIGKAPDAPEDRESREDVMANMIATLYRGKTLAPGVTMDAEVEE